MNLRKLGCKLMEAAAPQNSSASRGCFDLLAFRKGVWLDNGSSFMGYGRSATYSTRTRYIG
jgi:hypothetical protein